MKRTALAIVTAAVLALGAAQEAAATVVTEVPLPVMTDGADLIVRGVVEKRRTTNESGRLFTQVTIRVTEVHKGTLPKSGKLVVRTVGGRSGLTISRISGEPEFALGEDVFLFLNVKGAYHRVVAMAQGKFDIVRDPIARTEHLRRDLSGLSFVTRGSDGEMTISHEETQPIPADYRELVSAVRRQVLRTAATKARTLAGEVR